MFVLGIDHCLFTDLLLSQSPCLVHVSFVYILIVLPRYPWMTSGIKVKSGAHVGTSGCNARASSDPAYEWYMMDTWLELHSCVDIHVYISVVS